MDRLQEENWWITILKDKTVEPHNISSHLRCEQWWTAIACGKEESSPAAESATKSLAVNHHSPNNSIVAGQAVRNDLTVSNELAVSSGAASDSNAACVANRLNHSLDTFSLGQMLSAKVEHDNHSRRHNIQDKDILLKGIKKCKKLSFENPDRNLKRKSPNHSM